MEKYNELNIEMIGKTKCTVKTPALSNFETFLIIILRIMAISCGYAR